MKISNKIVSKFQEGGPMPAPTEGAPAGPEAGAPEGGQYPIAQIAEVAMQALQNQDCEAALAVCEAFVGLLQGGADGGGGAPPAGPEQGAPVYRKGGRLVRRVKTY